MARTKKTTQETLPVSPLPPSIPEPLRTQINAVLDSISAKLDRQLARAKITEPVLRAALDYVTTTHVRYTVNNDWTAASDKLKALVKAVDKWRQYELGRVLPRALRRTHVRKVAR